MEYNAHLRSGFIDVALAVGFRDITGGGGESFSLGGWVGGWRCFLVASRSPCLFCWDLC